MENFFNYITKQIPLEDVEICFRSNNIIIEKLDLYYDFIKSINVTIIDTYLGDDSSETKIVMSEDDNEKHFIWCWNKVIENFKKENIQFNHKGEHFDYLKTFFIDIFYNQKEDKVRKSINSFFDELFDIKKPFTKSDLDMLLTIYKLLEKNQKK